MKVASNLHFYGLIAQSCQSHGSTVIMRHLHPTASLVLACQLNRFDVHRRFFFQVPFKRPHVWHEQRILVTRIPVLVHFTAAARKSGLASTVENLIN